MAHKIILISIFPDDGGRVKLSPNKVSDQSEILPKSSYGFLKNILFDGTFY